MLSARLERFDAPVRKLMRELSLEPCQPRPWRHSLTEGCPVGPIPDLVGRDFTAQAPGERTPMRMGESRVGSAIV